MVIIGTPIKHSSQEILPAETIARSALAIHSDISGGFCITFTSAAHCCAAALRPVTCELNSPAITSTERAQRIAAHAWITFNVTFSESPPPIDTSTLRAVEGTLRWKANQRSNSRLSRVY